MNEQTPHTNTTTETIDLGYLDDARKQGEKAEVAKAAKAAEAARDVGQRALEITNTNATEDGGYFVDNETGVVMLSDEVKKLRENTKLGV
ncbi:hypothetical protein CR983_04180 [Candidatus Saccharibacteria bacterium]|nr:MAG: hypothetical protein CR983_04180 [Candidatus Saccharibacteria bacterium]